MNILKHLALTVVAGACLIAAAPKAEAQVSINIGPAPACSYGYYDYYPYACAPYGYYGPAWFSAGAFIGAGPWFHGDGHFRGHADDRFDAGRGYWDPAPHYGNRFGPSMHLGRVGNSRGHEMHDGVGHAGGYRGHGGGHRR